jgi:SAM-dependent methyltransferase
MTEADTRGADKAESRYALRGGEDAKRRLDLIAGVLQPTTATLLDQLGIKEGSRCLDAGCGGGHVVAELARRVGPHGSVLGLDLDPTVLELAAQEVDGAGNVTFRQGDVRTLQGEGYDVVYARFLLIHMADVADVLRLMAACLAPGGTVVVEDVDHSGVLTHPPDPAHIRYNRLFDELITRRGGDASIGLKLPELLRQAGLGGVGLRIVQPAFMTGPVKHVHAVTLTSVSESLVAEGMVSAQDARTLHAEMTRYADDETTIVTWPRIVQAWGRLPSRRRSHSRVTPAAWKPPPALDLSPYLSTAAVLSGPASCCSRRRMACSWLPEEYVRNLR